MPTYGRCSKTTNKRAMPNYNIAPNWDGLSPEFKATVINRASYEQLQKSDLDCNQRRLCAMALTKVQEKPFDPRIEISADGRHISGRIVKHLWIIFAALAFIPGVLYVLLK